MKALPRITVVMPSYNQGQYLERAIRSVVEQGYPNLEFMVYDGGSTDDSVSIIRRYADRIGFWQSAPDGGQTKAINAGWRRATGEIVTWLNSDDAYLPGALLHVGSWFASHPAAAMLFGKCQLVGADGEPIGTTGSHYVRRTMLLSHQPIPQPAAFVRRSIVDAVGFLDEDLDYVMDYEFFLRVAAVAEPEFVDTPLAIATTHPDAKTIAGRDRMVSERQAIRRRHARGWRERLLVTAQPIASRAYHALPSALRYQIDARRPKRIERVGYDEVGRP